MVPTTVSWPDAQAAVRAIAARVADLVRSVPDTGVAAIGSWNAGQLAAHMTHVFEVDLDLIQGGLSPLADLGDLAALTQAKVAAEGVVDLGALAERVEAAARQFLTEAARLDGNELRDWLGGTRMPVTALAAHVVSESMLHGIDLSTATGRPWTVERRDASLAFLGFICPMLAALDQPTFAVDQVRAAALRACFDIRLRGGGRVFFVFDRGALGVEAPSYRPVDCHLWIDPRAVMLLAWGRTGLASAMAKGHVVAWGRRPWLALRLPGLFTTP